MSGFVGNRRRGGSAQAPRYWEALGLRRQVAVVGWLIACVLVVGGVLVMVTFSESPVEGLGALSAMVGVLLVAGLLRCRQFEVTLAGSMLTYGTGPFVRRVTVDGVRLADVRLATGARRLYAEREVVLTGDGPAVTLPSGSPEELIDEVPTG